VEEASHDDDQQDRNPHKLNAVKDSRGAQVVARVREAQALLAGTRKTDEVSAAVAVAVAVVVVHFAARDGGGDHGNDFGHDLSGYVHAPAWEAVHKMRSNAPRIVTQEVTVGLTFLVDVEVVHMVCDRARAY